MSAPAIYYLGRTNEGNGTAIVTLAIGRARWDYWLPSVKADSAEYLARRVGPAKALAYTKRHATAQVKHD